MSDHCPIIASFSIDVKYWQVSETYTAQSKAKLDWDRATSEYITQYPCLLHKTLSQLQFPNDFWLVKISSVKTLLMFTAKISYILR